MCVCVVTVHADNVWGDTPETAKPFPAGMWFLPTLDGAPSEAWFTYTNTTDNVVNWGNCPAATEKQIYVYLCNGGQEAFQTEPGSDSYILFPGKEYLVKITPKAAGMFCMGQTGPNPNWVEGEFKYYPIDITAIQNQNQSVNPGETKWFKVKYDYASRLKTDYFMAPVANIERVEAIHIECPGGTNIGSGLIGPYIKAGESVIGVTGSQSATAPIPFGFALDGQMEVNCGNNRGFGKAPVSKMTVGTKSGYPDAYYTVDRYFEVPEDGTYTFTNHGAKGTILNVGKVEVVNGYNTCVWTDVKSATVGNEDAKVVMTGLVAGDKLFIESDAFGVIGEGTENMPYLLVEKGGTTTGIADITADGSTLKATAAAGKLNVESVLLAQGAEVAVYDMMARKVASATSAEGADSIEMNLDVNAGVYIVVVYGKGNSESVKIAVK